MSQRAMQIEDRLHSAGYKTERNGGEVQVLDPVYREVPGAPRVLDHHNLVEIRTIGDAWQFIEERRDVGRPV